MFKTAQIYLFFICLCAANPAIAASVPSDIEQQKIHYLLDAVASSDLIFIRNGKEYKGTDAKAHLQRKLNYAGNKITTAEDFIHYIASGSSFSGKTYMVKMPDGTEITSDAWLHEQLKKWDKKQAKDTENHPH